MITSTITTQSAPYPDAAQHLAGKLVFCKLDCSQAYHCLQMADQRSVEMLAFNFASRTFAYKRIAQGLKPFPINLFKLYERNTWIPSSKPTNVRNMWTILELQPIVLRNMSGTSRHYFHVFAKLD